MSKFAFDSVKIARGSKRPTGLDYINAIFNDFFELHGDRTYADDAAVVGGVAYLDRTPVTVIAIEKGHSIKERNARSSGAPHPEGYRKALRLMRQADKFHRPIICFVDTAGAYCGIGAEERGQGAAIADNLVGMMNLNVPIISVFIGEGGSGGALALGVADRVWMLENAVYSVISPEGCASILWKDAAKADVAADSLKLTAEDALAFGFAERIISEKDLGSRIFYKDLERALIQEVQALRQEKDLTANRYRRFRAFGLSGIEGKTMSIYEQFYTESIDDQGCLVDIDIHYPDNFNFGYDVVDAIAEKTPDKRALVWCNIENEEHIFSFADIRDESNRAANVLLENGIGRGDRVILALKRHYEYWMLAIACHKIGAVMIPVTHMLTTEDFIYRMRAAKVKAVVCTTQNHVPERVREAAAVLAEECPCKLWTVKEGVEGFACLTTAMASASVHLKRQETLASDPMVIYFTSGTSGYPKGVIHDFSYPLAHYVTAKYWQGVKDGGLHFTVSETGWAKASWGKLYGQWLNECAVMVYDFDNFEPRQMAAVINKYGVTSFCAPPTIYRYMTRKGTTDFPCLEHVGTAGEYLSPDVFTKFKEATGLDIMEGYGQTETTLLIANFIGKPAKDSALGLPSPLYTIELRSKDGSLTPDGQIGEVCVVPKDGKRPIGIFCGYLDDEERYRNAWRGGVYHTGDAVYKDEDGYYWFHGRFDDIIKSGGFRIGPYEIENVLMTHPAVMECSVIGIPDRLRGQAIKAMVTLAPGYESSRKLELEIRDYCNGQLAEYKWIRNVEILDDMSKTISGKIKKAEQRQHHAAL